MKHIFLTVCLLMFAFVGKAQSLETFFEQKHALYNYDKAAYKKGELPSGAIATLDHFKGSEITYSPTSTFEIGLTVKKTSATTYDLYFNKIRSNQNGLDQFDNYKKGDLVGVLTITDKDNVQINWFAADKTAAKDGWPFIKVFWKDSGL